MPRKEKLKNKLIVNRVYPEQYPEGLILFNLPVRTIYDIAVSQNKDFRTLLEAEGLDFYKETHIPSHLTLEDNGITIHCKTVKSESSKWDISISCELIDEKDIAIMEAFPLTLGCNKILKCRGNKFILQLKRNFQDLFLAKAFLSALFYFRLNNRLLK